MTGLLFVMVSFLYLVSTWVFNLWLVWEVRRLRARVRALERPTTMTGQGKGKRWIAWVRGKDRKVHREELPLEVKGEGEAMRVLFARGVKSEQIMSLEYIDPDGRPAA